MSYLRQWIPLASIALIGLACTTSEGQVAERPPIIGGPCEGCDAVYVGLPEEPAATMRIAPKNEPGEPMRIEGVVRRADGKPAAGVIVYAYHTDKGGVYPRDDALRGTSAYRHGRLRGWAETGTDGRYRFDTIRPGGYPNSTIAQHVHMHVIEPECCTYYIDSIEFTDDPRLRSGAASARGPHRGGLGIVTPERKDGVWVVRRDIVLGEGVPGYTGGTGGTD